MSTDQNKQHLHNQLIKLGDMMGDGLHHEPGGAWITKEYRQVCKALGYVKSKPRNVDGINKAMAAVIERDPCRKCQGKLKQSRSGSMRAECTSCKARYQYKRAKRC